MQTTFGTSPRLLVRTNDPDTSHEAATKIDSTFLEQLVYSAIYRFGARGCISDDVRDLYPEYPYSSITARYRALLDKDLIVDTGERRQGHSGRRQRVVKATFFNPKGKHHGPEIYPNLFDS